ncbi:hypothetical protein BDY19DRAFT_992901 [Irpex rosettiformis]|uniref:Uncharacterized protein n=1 Tax=Irpex rosettiformis TaxID=378272 RepID=A0ACB8U6V4_9APHY|nr:hypothetical protein BDY19DRAFT_992901 [Irpex rosettiformis]
MRPTLRVVLYQTHYFEAHPLLRPSTVSAESGELWIAIRGDAASIPPNTARSFYNEDFISTDTTYLPEALKGPAWVGGPKGFLAYGVDLRGDPNVAALINQPWFLSSFLVNSEFMDHTDPDQISPDLALKVRQDLKLALEVVRLLDGRGGVLDGHVNRKYAAADIDSQRGVEEVRQELLMARGVFDERCAAINYGLLHTQTGSKAWIVKHYRAYLRQWRLLGPMRGALLDMCNLEPRHVYVLDMLAKGVAVYYPLDDCYRASLPDDEAESVYQIQSKELFCKRLALTCFHPPLDMSQPDLWPTYHPPSEEQPTSPGNQLPVSRLERMEELSQRIRTSLGDLLRSPESATPIILDHPPAIRTIGSARLLVGPLTELRLMAWSITHRSASTARILEEALARGWPFSLVYPSSYLESVKVARDLPATLSPTPESIDVPEVEDDYDVQTEWKKQLIIANKVLSRLHGQAFLYEGDLLWRLALLYGSSFIENWRARGLDPSVSVTTYGLGREEQGGYRGDQVSELEKRLLLGTVRHRGAGTTLSWFPSPVMFARHGFCNGEWSLAAEVYIRGCFDSLQKGEENYLPLSEAEWERELSGVTIDKLLRDSLVIPDSEEIEEMLQRARTEFRTGWNAQSLDDIERGIGRGGDVWWKN